MQVPLPLVSIKMLNQPMSPFFVHRPAAAQGDVLGEYGHGLLRAWCTDVPTLADLDEDHSRRKSVARHDTKSSSVVCK